MGLNAISVPVTPNISRSNLPLSSVICPLEAFSWLEWDSSFPLLPHETKHSIPSFPCWSPYPQRELPLVGLAAWASSPRVRLHAFLFLLPTSSPSAKSISNSATSNPTATLWSKPASYFREWRSPLTIYTLSLFPEIHSWYNCQNDISIE